MRHTHAHAHKSTHTHSHKRTQIHSHALAQAHTNPLTRTRTSAHTLQALCNDKHSGTYTLTYNNTHIETYYTYINIRAYSNITGKSYVKDKYMFSKYLIYAFLKDAAIVLQQRIFSGPECATLRRPNQVGTCWGVKTSTRCRVCKV